MRGRAVNADTPPYLPFTGALPVTKARSQEAADQMAGSAETRRGRLYALLKAMKALGLTDDEQQQHLGWDGSTQRPRRVELFQRGLIQPAAFQRLTRSGRWATVWVAVDFPPE